MNAGERVGAVSHEEDDILYVYGFGTYMGRRRPSECKQKPVGMIGEIVMKGDYDSPLIELDDGNYVWGCECWFGAEDKIRQHMESYDAVETINIVEKRAEFIEYSV